ncbi:flagellar hook-associated protein FlgL [Nitrospinaceae bacterium]|nr:flagellar hook-associated protein FlgL [Nitrospinaceae bacterium]
MVMRVTSQTQQRNALNNIFRITEAMFNAQKEITSGKKIQKPSDDPSGMRDTLVLRTNIKQIKQFDRNINSNQLFLSRGESALDSIGVSMSRAKELSMVELGGMSTSETRGYAKTELDNIISKVLQEANTKVKNMYIFSGTDVNTTPFELSASGAVCIYNGNSDNLMIQIEEDINVKVNIAGSEVLGTDLDPNLNTSTKVSKLNGGSGIASGAISITDRAGISGTFTITSSMTLANVITAIENVSSNLTASINSSGNGITITDTSSVIKNSLTVSEVDGGITALSLGIVGTKDGNIEGMDLNAALSTSTLISELNGGEGLTLGDINIINGAASGAVSLSSATTIAEVISLINNSGNNVTASIDSAGSSLQVISNSSSTIAVVSNVGTDTTAEELGIGGGRNVINTLFKLKQAMEYDDTFAILGSLANLDSGLETINESRAIYGAVARRIISTETTHQQNIVNQKDQISKIEGADMVEAASEFAAMEAALQASLSSTARIIQPSLLDFLR